MRYWRTITSLGCSDLVIVEYTRSAFGERENLHESEERAFLAWTLRLQLRVQVRLSTGLGSTGAGLSVVCLATR